MAGRWLSVQFAIFLCCASGAVAESPTSESDFTFRRIGVPQNGAERGLVQIQPGDQDAYLNGVEAPVASHSHPEGEAEAPKALPYAWFWSAVSPRIDASEGQARMELAVEQIINAPETDKVTGPRLQTMQNIAAQYRTEILTATIGTNISPALVLAVIGVESSGRPDAVSSAGAQGLMQLIPATAERFGVTDSTDPTENIRAGVAYLDWLMKEFDNDPILALAGYNAGENAVKENGGVPPYAETRAYVPKVINAWTIARGLCVTPPELVSDGCVFAVERLASDG